MLSRLKIVLAVFLFVCQSLPADAAVRLITETEYGFSPFRLLAAAGDCEYDACPVSYTGSSIVCNYQNAKSGRACVDKKCCKGNEEITVKECPPELRYSLNSTDDIANLSSVEYCDGYQNGIHKVYFYENPEQCHIKGITDNTYLEKLSSSGACGSSDNVKNVTCLRESDGGNAAYCQLINDSSGYHPCPSDYSAYQHSTCGTGNDQPAIPCILTCGASTRCVGYTCKTENIPLCSTLENEKKAEGWYSSGVSATYNAARGIINQCMKDGAVHYVGFYCKDYWSEANCSAANGTKGESCTIYSGDSGSGTVYSCSCGDYKTLEEYCATNHSGDTNCLRNYYGVGKSCLIDKDAAGNSLTKYERFEDTIKPCEFYDKGWMKTVKTGDECPSFAGEAAANKATCRDGSGARIEVCLYCHNYIATTKADAEEKCGYGAPIECHYEENKVVYSGCTCEGTGFKTITEWCSEEWADNANCSTQAKGTGKECETDDGTFYYDSIGCNDSFSLKEEWCAANPDKIAADYTCDNYVGKGEACILDAGDDESKYKYSNFTLECPSELKTVSDWCAEEWADNADCAVQAVGTGKECRPETDDGSEVVLYEKIACSSNYQTKEEWCAANPNKIIDGWSCNDYIPLSEPCVLEAEGDASKYKYLQFGLGCPTGADTRVKNSTEECLLEGETEAVYDTCYVYDEESKKYSSKYICKCPSHYGLECDEAYKVRGGVACSFDRSASGLTLTKYAYCGISCGNTFAKSYADTPYGCDDVDTYIATIRGGFDTPEKCVMSSNKKEFFICGCPKNFKTLDEWCEENYAIQGLADAYECVSSYTGMGKECSWDIENDASGNPHKSLSKYAYFVRYCPTTRPLYYSQDDCRYIGGEYDYSCVDNANNERAVCRCPESWYLADGSRGETSGESCLSQSIGDTAFAAEASGEYCDFDGSDKLRYKDCTVKCSDMLEKKALGNAYTYLSADNATPTQTLCATKMGNGAVLGYGNQAYCSLNHTLMYPCYCPQNMKECLAENNEVAADNATVCSINGKTYYSECQLMNCPKETAQIAIVDTDTDIAATFGPAAEYSACLQDGEEKRQVSCDAKVYNDPCEYPYEAPSSGSWCKHGEGDKLMKDGRAYYKSGACRVKKELGKCGSQIVGGDTDSNYTIFVAGTESECLSKYGPGISTQLCEYGAEQGYKRAYNCYYDASEFRYTTANCGVRHDLTGNYIIVNGQKRWNECKCASAYQHHKFNCGGLLSGNPCSQELTQSLIDKDATLKEAVDEGYELNGKTLPFYPYCQCSADYTEICDEDGSGRYKGVGTACNGKYTACECVPDELPDNWADNYYGCPGGKKPTGVWKDNGCGKKYYQCTVVECTWEYTEMCEAPLIPVGQSCQDNEGKIGGYKACTCPAEYQVCPAGQVGEGEPCNLKGVAHYKSCKTQETCSSLANETCNGPLQIGVNPCTRDDITYYESCVCANGYNQVCGEEEVGVGNYCEIDGKKYYKECTKPDKTECTEGHVIACDTNQESYSPCVATDGDGKQVVKYLCKCPSNWSTCGGVTPGAIDGVTIEKCVQTAADGSQTTYYSECNTEAATCSPYQELTYKVCSSAQIGEGGHCLSQRGGSSSGSSSFDGDLPLTGESGETVVENGITYTIKYASCKDSNECLTNGFKYSCSGYDASTLGEYCIDANGNKLYKSCPCPSGYTTCSNPNASKGSKCIPLLEDGSLGPVQYSTCACDKSKYKYTCAPEGGNKGIRPPKTINYCEIEEDVTTTSVDEEGNTTTSTSKQPVKYYTSCDCAEEYKYACTSNSSGEIIPLGYTQDYCQINSTRFYKGCGCDSDVYKVSQEDCPGSAGQTVDISKGSCTVRGYRTSQDEEGNITEQLRSNVTMYKSCICKSNYTLPCDSPLYDQTDIVSCDLDEARKLYPRCKCKSENEKLCQTSGKNQGIKPDESSICTEKLADGNGGASEQSKYTRCICKENYRLSCKDGKDGWFNQTNETYCETGEVDAAGNIEERQYQRCVCNSSVYDNNAEMPTDKSAEDYCLDQGKQWAMRDNDPSEQYCDEQDARSEDGTTIIRRRPNRNLCCTSDVSGYTQLDSNSYSTTSELIDTYTQEGLEAKIRQLCGHEYNAELMLDCNGLPYYKCSNATVASQKSTTWRTAEQCSEGGSKREVKGTKQTISASWIKKADVYPDCGCNSIYKYTSDDDCKSYYDGLGMNNSKLFCTDSFYSVSSSRKIRCSYEVFKLYPGDVCTELNGTAKYSRCVCKQGGDATNNDSCISDYCGDPSKGSDDDACWIGGIPEINSGNVIRVSVLNGGGSGNDRTCRCPKARTSADLNGCSGNDGTEYVSSCSKYPYVKYPGGTYDD